MYAFNFKTPNKAQQTKLVVKGSKMKFEEMSFAEQQKTQSKTQNGKRVIKAGGVTTKTGKVSHFDDLISEKSTKSRKRK